MARSAARHDRPQPTSPPRGGHAGQPDARPPTISKRFRPGRRPPDGKALPPDRLRHGQIAAPTVFDRRRWYQGEAGGRGCCRPAPHCRRRVRVDDPRRRRRRPRSHDHGAPVDDRGARCSRPGAAGVLADADVLGAGRAGRLCRPRSRAQCSRGEETRDRPPVSPRPRNSTAAHRRDRGTKAGCRRSAARALPIGREMNHAVTARSTTQGVSAARGHANRVPVLNCLARARRAAEAVNQTSRARRAVSLTSVVVV